MTARFTRLAASLPATVPFVGPETQERERGRPFAARIGANENIFGPSPKAVAAMRAVAGDVWMYGDPLAYDLRHALADHLSIPPEAIMIGEGIDGLLGLTVRLFVEPGDAVVTSAGAYPTFNYHVAGFAGRLECVPYRDDAEDPAALAEAARTQDARLVYLANPDNPMGSWNDAGVVTAMLERLPDGTLLCLDEAYLEFAPEGTAPPIDVSDTRLLRFRTFSKAYGLAGLRVGYVIGHPDLIAGFDRIRNHFGVNRMAQAAALAALAVREYLGQVLRRVDESRERIAGLAAENGLATLPSATNFVAIDCGADGDFARAVLAALIARDVFVRMPGVAPMDRCIRVSAGTEREMEILARTLPEALAEARERA